MEKNIYPFDVINKKFKNKGINIYPISYIPDVKTFLCNETGKKIFFMFQTNLVLEIKIPIGMKKI